MKFRELMDRYEKGIASEEERILIEQEIERYEAIEEHVASHIDMDFMSHGINDEQAVETIKLKRSVNSRLRKVVLTSVAAVMLIVLGIFFIISPIIDSLYYNPTDITVGESESDFFFDQNAYTELNLPGYTMTSPLGIESLGFGKHAINFGRRNLFTQEENNISTKINKNRFIGNNKDFLGESYINFIYIREPKAFDPEYIENQKDRVMNHVKKLSPVAYVSAYLTFEEDLTMEKFHEMSFGYSNNINFAWVGVRTEPKNESVSYLTGFLLAHNSRFLSNDKPDLDKYPAIHFLDWLRTNNPGSGQLKSFWPEGYELHYTSLLKYMVDRKDVVTVLDSSPKADYYKSALDYVEEHGVKTFGVLVYANAEDLIELVENESIKTLELDQVMASKRYIN